MRAPIPLPDFLPQDAGIWASENRDLLERIVDALVESGEWPSLKKLTRQLAREHQPVALDAVIGQMPKPLGFLDGGPDRRIILTLFGLRATSSGHKLLAGFSAALRLAKERYTSEDDGDPILTRADIEGFNSKPVADAISEILLREAPFLGSGSGLASEGWNREVTADVVRYFDAADAESFLRIRATELSTQPQFGWDRQDAQASRSSQAAGPPETRDAFICHAGADKNDVARPLALALRERDFSVWFDEDELVVGDSLREAIDSGLSRSSFGVVVLSRAFFEGHWPRRELDALAARENVQGKKVILPVWHGIDHHDLVDLAPTLAGLAGVSTDRGIAHVAGEVARAIRKSVPDERR